MTWSAWRKSTMASMVAAVRHCGQVRARTGAGPMETLKLVALSLIAVLAYSWGMQHPAHWRTTGWQAHASIPSMANQSIELAVIIPCLARTDQQVRQLHRAVRSVLPQLRGEEEIIVIDDGSPHALVFNWPGRRPIVVRQNNRGPAAARNLGLRHARSMGAKSACFIDADVVAAPGWLAAMRDAQHQQPGIYGGITLSLDPRSAVGHFHNAMGTLNGRLAARPPSTLLYAPSCNLGIPIVWQQRPLLFDDHFPSAAFEDVELCIRARKMKLPCYAKLVQEAVVYHDYECSLAGLWKEFERYGKSHGLMVQKHPEYNDWFAGSREIGSTASFCHSRSIRDEGKWKQASKRRRTHWPLRAMFARVS